MGKRLVHRLMAAAVLLLVIVLNGCATQQYHDWYEGEVASAAVVHSQETLLVESINGRETDATFIGQNHTYELPPGEYTLVITYADIFDKTADDFEKVKSNPVKLMVVLEAGKEYQLQHPAVKGLTEAKVFADKPAFSVIDVESGKVVTAKLEYTTPRSILSRLKFESEQEQVFASDYLKQSSDKTIEPAQTETEDTNLSALKMLKFSWQQASARDREAFLQWIKQP